MHETWRPVSRFPGYEVSNLGRVKRLARDKRGTGRGTKSVYYTVPEIILKPYLHKNTGYLSVGLGVKYLRVTKTVHQLVAEAFLPPKPTSKHTVDHDDGDRQNNVSTNLKWSTHSEQRETSRKNGMLPVGEKHYLSFLSDEEVERIKQRYVKGCPENGGAAIAREYNCDRSTINKIMAGVNRAFV